MIMRLWRTCRGGLGEYVTRLSVSSHALIARPSIIRQLEAKRITAEYEPKSLIGRLFGPRRVQFAYDVPQSLLSIRSFSTKTPDASQIISSNLRKPNRRRRPLSALYKSQSDEHLPKVVGMAKAESFDLCGIFEDDRISSLYQITFVDDESEEGLHLTPREQYRINDSIKDAFVFGDGVLVAWNMEYDELSQLQEFLQPFEVDPYGARLIHEETETVAFTHGPRIAIKKDVINLAKSDENAEATTNDVLDRYAISHGIAASVKIAIWEQQLNEYAEPLYATTKYLIRGNIPWGRKESLRRTGEFAALRQSINLDSGLLNTDFYWDHAALERTYNLARKYFVVDKRLRELNIRLDYCQHLVGVIDDMLAHRHASRLEWLIIILIVIEVIFDMLHYFDNPSAPVFPGRRTDKKVVEEVVDE